MENPNRPNIVANTVGNVMPTFLESVLSKLVYLKFEPDQDEVIAYGNEIIMDIEHTVGIDTSLPICDNAIIEGILSKYVPDRLPYYQNELKNLKYKAYDYDTYPKENRTTRILKSIKDTLRTLGLPKESDDKILDRISEVQNEIILETRMVDKEFTIVTTPNLDIYTNVIDDRFHARSIFNITTNQEINYTELVNWSKVGNMGIGVPKYVTTFNNNIKFSPIPNDKYTIVFICYQKQGSRVTLDNEPELPSYCDNALINGVKAKYDPNFYQLYLNDKNMIKDNSTKYSGIKQFRNTMRGSW